MIERRIELKTIEDKENFLKVANSVNCEVDLRRGQTMIDGKSKLAVMAFDSSLGTMKLRLHTNDKNIAGEFVKWFV